MGTLIPGATYIYEYDGQKIYARESGSQARQLVGETMSAVYQQRQDDHLWRQIRAEAEINPTLRDALDKVITIYQLSRKHG